MGRLEDLVIIASVIVVALSLLSLADQPRTIKVDTRVRIPLNDIECPPLPLYVTTQRLTVILKLVDCMGGPNQEPRPTLLMSDGVTDWLQLGCSKFDLNGDGDVDLRDFADMTIDAGGTER